MAFNDNPKVPVQKQGFVADTDFTFEAKTALNQALTSAAAEESGRRRGRNIAVDAIALGETVPTEPVVGQVEFVRRQPRQAAVKQARPVDQDPLGATADEAAQKADTFAEAIGQMDPAFRMMFAAAMDLPADAFKSQDELDLIKAQGTGLKAYAAAMGTKDSDLSLALGDGNIREFIRLLGSEKYGGVLSPRDAAQMFLSSESNFFNRNRAAFSASVEEVNAVTSSADQILGTNELRDTDNEPKIFDADELIKDGDLFTRLNDTFMSQLDDPRALFSAAAINKAYQRQVGEPLRQAFASAVKGPGFFGGAAGLAGIFAEELNPFSPEGPSVGLDPFSTGLGNFDYNANTGELILDEITDDAEAKAMSKPLLDWVQFQRLRLGSLNQDSADDIMDKWSDADVLYKAVGGRVTKIVGTNGDVILDLGETSIRPFRTDSELRQLIKARSQDTGGDEAK